MKNKTIVTESQRANIVASIKKMVEDKAIVRSFLQGKISKDVLNQKGIKIAKPI